MIETCYTSYQTSLLSLFIRNDVKFAPRILVSSNMIWKQSASFSTQLGIYSASSVLLFFSLPFSDKSFTVVVQTMFRASRWASSGGVEGRGEEWEA